MNSSRLPFPRVFKTKARYHDFGLSLNAGASGAAANYVFGANFLKDPDVTGTGHKAIGFDQIVGVIYDHFLVKSAKITVTFMPQDTVPMIVGIATKDNSTTTSSVNELIENGAHWTAMETDDAQGPVQVSKMVSIKKFLGKKKIADDDQLRGSTAADPVEGVYFHVFAAAHDGTTDPGPVSFSVQIDYNVNYIEPKQLGTS